MHQITNKTYHYTRHAYYKKLPIEFEIHKNIYAHDINNPPTETVSSNITLELDGPNCSLELVKGPLFGSTEYELVVEKPLELGFTSSEQSIFVQELQNLILSLNLTLARVCITQENVIIPKGGVKIKPPETRVSTNKNGNRTSVNIGETIVFRDEVYVTVGVSERVSCQKVIEIFKKLQSLNRFDKRKARPLKLSNFTKALKEYEDAMSSMGRPLKFKHLFNALELVANIDGMDRKGEVFDQKVARQCGINKVDVKDWRELYNRTKHADRDYNDVKKHHAVFKGLGRKYIKPVRSCCMNILIDVLMS